MNKNSNESVINIIKSIINYRSSETYARRLSNKQVALECAKEIRKYEKIKKQIEAGGINAASKMQDENNVVEFDNLKTYFFTDAGVVKAVDGVSFAIPKGKTVGVVGESGCGKSVTSLSLMKLVQAPSGQIVEGEIRYNNKGRTVDIAKLPNAQMQKIRGNEIAMIFQEPMTSLNPIFTIGSQIEETLELHETHLSKAEIKKKTIDMLKLVGIARAEGIYKAYPHELSGGMRQRVMIAMALACDPNLIIADEPTTALDVTIQAQILDLLRNLKSKVNASIMLITHDLGVVAEMADYVVVMYAGRIVEQGTAHDIFLSPKHPYTQGLLESKPMPGKKVERLYSIPGQTPNPINMPDHCYFKDRCKNCFARCEGTYPPLHDMGPTRKIACWLYEKEGK